jgi:hypothetical protein
VEDFIGLVAVGGLWITLSVVAVTAFQTARSARREVHETARAAIGAGQELSPDVLQALQAPARSPTRDLRTGLLLTTAAGGLAACAALAFATEGGDDWTGFVYGALVIGSVGVAHLLAARFVRPRG